MNRRRALLLVLAGLAAASFACFPKPHKPIDYLALPDAIIIQKKTTILAALDKPLEDACRTPEFTLYGDGTLLVLRPEGPGYSLPVLRAKLSADEIRALLTPAVKEGFMDYEYAPRSPEALLPTQYRSRTFLYVHTQDAANAMSVANIDRDPPAGAGKDWDQFRRIKALALRLDGISSGLGARDLLTFERTGTLLAVKPWDGETRGPVSTWMGSISLASVAPPGSGLVIKQLDTTAGVEVIPGGLFSEGGRVFLACTRPLLAHEDNFPEFEAPQ